MADVLMLTVKKGIDVVMESAQEQIVTTISTTARELATLQSAMSAWHSKATVQLSTLQLKVIVILTFLPSHPIAH